jgi:hypothetical protein
MPWPRSQGGVVGGQHAALARGQGLDRMEREAGEGRIGAVTDRMGDAVEGRDRAQGVGRVLDQHRAGSGRQFAQHRQVADVAAQMDGQHGLHPATRRAGQSFCQGFGRHQAAVGIDIGEHHLGPDVAGAVGGGQEGDRRGDADVALADAERQHGQVQGGGAVGHGDGVLGPDLGLEGRLEGLDGRARGQEVGAQGRRHRRHVVVLDGLTAVGKERRLRHQAFSASMAFRPSSLSQSSLLSLL